MTLPLTPSTMTPVGFSNPVTPSIGVKAITMRMRGEGPKIFFKRSVVGQSHNITEYEQQKALREAELEMQRLKKEAQNRKRKPRDFRGLQTVFCAKPLNEPQFRTISANPSPQRLCESQYDDQQNEDLDGPPGHFYSIQESVAEN
jgi:hypothetical protein